MNRQRLGMVALCVLASLALVAGAARCAASDDADRELSPRELYNSGTAKLHDGNLTEAESLLQGAVATQNGKVQPAALYNLGLTRFNQGTNELTNAPPPRALDDQSSAAAQHATNVLHEIDDALAGTDVPDMVSAYLRGRGARKDLKSAMAAVQRAMDTYGVVLAKWRRASGDFHGTVELHPSDADARRNADLTDQHIAKLVDRLNLLMALRAAMGQQRDELQKKLSMLKGKIPDIHGDPMLGDDGDDDDGDAKPSPRMPNAGEHEGPIKNGRRMEMTPEEAQRLLGLLQLDTGRKLYLGDRQDTPPDGKKRDW